MAEDPAQPDAIRFEHEEHDVTCCCERLFGGSTVLILGAEEAELVRTLCCGACRTEKRGPYGELGTVDSSLICCCFYGFGAASLMTRSDGGGEQMQCTGCGCEKERVDKLVEELKKRQQMRGDRAKVRLAESTVKSLERLHEKVDLILDHLQIEPPSDEMQRN